MNITKNVAGIQKICSKSKIREELTGICFGDGKAVATDSFSLIEVKSDLLEGEAFILADLKVKKEADVQVVDGVAHIVEAGKKTLIPVIEGSFPDYEKVMDDSEPLATIKVNAKYLANVCTALSGFDPFSKVSLSIKKDRIEITTKGADGEVRAIIMALTS